MTIAQNYEIIRERMQKACERAGRKEQEVHLVAVSKYVETERIAEVIALGQRLFGENHAQELVEKKTFFEHHGCDVHFIGQLQTNKIKYVCGSASMIESVDRVGLAEALQRKSEALNLVSEILIQVNIGNEAQKGGVAPEDLDSFMELLNGCSNLRPRGLMCVPPALPQEETRPYFRRMRQLFEQTKLRYGALNMDTLSMGMSHDFEVAIEEGATEVRVGTALFGARGKL